MLYYRVLIRYNSEKRGRFTSAVHKRTSNQLKTEVVTLKDTPDKKSWYRRVRDQARNLWFATLFLISVMLMAVLHILYKIPSPCRFLAVEWTAGEALSYAGSIIGAVSTIYVLQETIHSTVKMQQEERVFSLRPYFLIKAASLAFEMLYSDAADLARYRVCCGIRIVRSGNIVSAYAGRPVTEWIARSGCMNFQEKDVWQGSIRYLLQWNGSMTVWCRWDCAKIRMISALRLK